MSPTSTDAGSGETVMWSNGPITTSTFANPVAAPLVALTKPIVGVVWAVK